MCFLESCGFVKKYDYCNGIVHSVKKGDTLYTLSRQYDIPLALLLRANPYVDIYNMQVGDEICIPFDFVNTPGETPSTPVPPVQTPSIPPTQTPPTASNTPSVTIPNRPPMITPGRPSTTPCSNKIFYVVKENDTLASILDYFDIELEDLLRCNSMNEIKLLPGNRIQITLTEHSENNNNNFI